MRNCIEIIHACLQLYKTFIIGNFLQNFNDQYCKKLCITNSRCCIFRSGENLAMKSGGRRLN